MPVFNGSHTICGQIDALVSQTLSPDELVISDNGSTDATPQIVAQYASRYPWIRIVDASSRRGAAYARNVGVEASIGSKILLCDADDVVGPEWCEALSAGLDDFDSVGGVLVPFTGSEPNWNGPASRPSVRFRYLPAPLTANAGLTRRMWDHVGGFDDRYRSATAEDVDLFWRIQQSGGSYAVVDEARVAYRLRESPKAKFVQEYRYGKEDVRLYKIHKQRGMPRSPWRRVVYRWIHLLISSPRLLMGPDLRLRWIGHAGKNLGRARGSIQHCQVFL